jgi:hypothetical protein
VENINSGDIDFKKKREIDLLRLSTDTPQLDIENSPRKKQIKTELNLNLNFSMESAYSTRKSDSFRRTCIGSDYDLTKINKKRGYRRAVRAIEDPRVRGLNVSREDSGREFRKHKQLRVSPTESVSTLKLPSAESPSNRSTNRSMISAFNQEAAKLPNKCKIAYVSHIILYYTILYSFIYLLIHV